MIKEFIMIIVSLGILSLGMLIYALCWVSVIVKLLLLMRRIKF